MRIALAADELTGVARTLPDELRGRGYELDRDAGGTPS
jgi:hypothetical protein